MRKTKAWMKKVVSDGRSGRDDVKSVFLLTLFRLWSVSTLMKIIAVPKAVILPFVSLRLPFKTTSAPMQTSKYECRSSPFAFSTSSHHLEDDQDNALLAAKLLSQWIPSQTTIYRQGSSRTEVTTRSPKPRPHS